MVHGHRIAAFVGDARLGAEGCGHCHRDAADRGFEIGANLFVERPDRTRQAGRLRNDIIRVAGVEGGHRHYARGERIGVARHDRLKGGDQLGADQNGIDRLVRAGGMAAPAEDVDVEAVGRGHDGAGAHGEAAHRQARQIVDAVDLVHGKPLEQAILDHCPCAGAALLGGLKHEDHGAGKVALGGEMAGGGEQGRRVAVVSAGMHGAWLLGGPGSPGDLLDRQGIHVGAQRHGAVSRPPSQYADDTAAADPGRHLVQAEGTELFGDKGRGLVEGVEQFGTAMQIAAPEHGFPGDGGDLFKGGQGLTSLRTIAEELQPSMPATTKARANRWRG